MLQRGRSDLAGRISGMRSGAGIWKPLAWAVWTEGIVEAFGDGDGEEVGSGEAMEEEAAQGVERGGDGEMQASALRSTRQLLLNRR